MKRFIAICVIMLTAVTTQATPTNDITIEDLNIVKYFNSTTAAVPVEISKPNTYALVIEYDQVMYVIDHEVLTHVYKRTDSDWFLYTRPNTPLYTILREYSHVSFYTEADGTPYLIIERIDGNGSYTMSYTDTFPDPGNNGTVYMNDHEYITIGEDYAVLNNKDYRTYYKFIPNN
jgi:hypothetical protein